MTDAQYERFEQKLSELTTGISALTTNVEILTHRINKIEDPEIVDLKKRITINELGIRNNDKKVYGATLAIFVLFTFLQFAAANGWLTYPTRPAQFEAKQNAHQ